MNMPMQRKFWQILYVRADKDTKAVIRDLAMKDYGYDVYAEDFDFCDNEDIPMLHSRVMNALSSEEMHTRERLRSVVREWADDCLAASEEDEEDE